jgi:hypothetical protein
MGEKFAPKFKRKAGKMRLFEGIKPGIKDGIYLVIIPAVREFSGVLCR